jgi:DNA-binding NarL/FixJ family response regulator
MTGFNDESFAENMIDIGAQGYLIKGKVDSNQLIRTINNAIETKLAEKASPKNTK